MTERKFKLPDLGEGLTEGEVVRWLVSEGDTITLNQPIVEVETAKAVVEIPSPYAGTVVKLHAGEGDTLDVGAPLVSVDTGGGGSDRPAAAEPAKAPGPDQEQELQATLVGPGEREQVRRRRVTGPARDGQPAPAPATPARQRPRATPPVRRYAKDLGVDLGMVIGSGRDGRITRDDVDDAVGQPLAVVAVTRPQPDQGFGSASRSPEERIPVRGTRKQIAAAMVASASSIPHVTEFLTVDATRLMELRARLREQPAAAEVKVTPLAIVAKALCVAVRSYPLMNSAWEEGRLPGGAQGLPGGAQGLPGGGQGQPSGGGQGPAEIVVKGYVNLGIATDTPSGLLVPNIKDAGALGILDLARELVRLTALARERRAAPAELTGGTITVTNVGGFGVETGTPIINKPECAIVATGLIAARPWVVGGQLAVRQLMTISVSFDHRIVDGAYAARFLVHLRDLLEDPALLGAF